MLFNIKLGFRIPKREEILASHVDAGTSAPRHCRMLINIRC